MESPLDVPIPIEEIVAASKVMKANTAPGPDCIHSQFITRASPVIYEDLLLIFDLSWSYGVVPGWKDANAFALFKKGNISDPSAYRIISVTSVIVRTFERVWNTRATEHL